MAVFALHLSYYRSDSRTICNLRELQDNLKNNCSAFTSSFKCCSIQTMTLYINVFRFELNLDFRIVIRSAALDHDLHGVARLKLGLLGYLYRNFRCVFALSKRVANYITASNDTSY